MIRILANDGIHPDGQLLLEEAGYEVITEQIPQEKLAEQLPAFDAVIVRSATKIRKALIEQCPNLKLIARAGVGMDNIDVEFANQRGIKVINTPNASSLAVAELVIGQLFTLARFLHQANREMPTIGASQFKHLKEHYSEGSQLRGKTLGIIGFGRIGQEVARIALAIGMRVLATDISDRKIKVYISTPDIPNVSWAVDVKTVSFERVLTDSDFITVHVPDLSGKAVLGEPELQKMKDGAAIVNTSRGGVVDEEALIKYLDSGKLSGAALDVFIGEPKPNEAILKHPKISLTPHIGASTVEAQRYIGLELADALIEHFGTE